jgi:hypothetical protein
VGAISAPRSPAGHPFAPRQLTPPGADRKYLIAITGNFGFFAPVLAKEPRATLDAIGQDWPVAVNNGLAAITFMIGYIVLGIAITILRPCLAGPVSLLRWALRRIWSPPVYPSWFQRPHGRSRVWAA